MSEKIKVVVFGGGGGIKPIIEGFKNFYDLTAIVTVSDDGGSTGKLRDYCGIGIGDLRNALLSISREDEENAIVREILTHRLSGNYSLFFSSPYDIVEKAAGEMKYDKYNINRVIAELERRFKRNGLSFKELLNMPITSNGHPVGNLILCFLIMKSRERWVELSNDIFGSIGKVYPNTTEKSRLVASFDGFSDTVGESYFDNPDLRIPPIQSIRLEPHVSAYEKCIEAIEKADYIVIAPGSFYASVVASLLPEGYRETLSRKKIIWFPNLFYDLNQTLYRIPNDEREEIIFVPPSRQVEILEEKIGKKPDLIIAQDHAAFPKDPDILERYKGELGIEEIMPDYSNLDIKFYLADLASLDYTQMKRGPGYVFRHDPQKVLKSFRNAIAKYNL
ncbi:MAG: YvcK family protein [Candidatus Aenigmarchaeota archaeon]|nr:YvcK family protein [Candidatus Aenigmarchaeota archaeon]